MLQVFHGIGVHIYIYIYFNILRYVQISQLIMVDFFLKKIILIIVSPLK